MSGSSTMADYASGGRLTAEDTSQRCLSNDSLTEVRSCGQVENGTPSTSLPYWDTDDDDCEPKPSVLYGKFTWKIEKFSQINKRELRSNAFEVGGYKWYILIYPQGCDICNHLSLFLCVANHDELLPGWSHFAQFTIAVVNNDPKKSKYSDTLHRFWKKERDWGWKKFIELSKVYDGFINEDSLVIKAQVQVISSIEVAYQEAVALERQEELIREEEAAEQAEYELKAKRSAVDKEKRTKKKQAKQRQNSRKVKDRTRDEKSDIVIQDKHLEQSPSDESLFEEFSSKKELGVAENFGTPGNTLDTSDTGDDVAEMIQLDLEDRDCSLVNWDTDTSEIHPTIESSNVVIQNGQSENRSTSTVDDSSLTCSTDSVPSVVTNRSYKGSSLKNTGRQTSAHRGKNQWSRDTQNQPSDACYLSGATGSCRTSRTVTEPFLSLNAGRQILEHHLVEQEEKELNVKDQVDVKQTSNSRTSDTPSALGTTGKPPYVLLQQPKQSSENVTATSIRPGIMTVEAVTVKESNSNSSAPSTVVCQATRQVSVSKSEVEKHPTPTKSTPSQQTAAMSRPSSAPLIPAPRPTVTVVSTVQTAPLLSRSVSASGRLGTDPSPSAPPFVPQSYRNAITGKNDVSAIPTGFAHPSVTPLSQTFLSSIAALLPQTAARKDQASVISGLTFGSMKRETLQTQYRPNDDCSHPEPSSSSSSSSSTGLYHSNYVTGMRMMNISSELQARKHCYSGRVPSGVMSFPPQGVASDEFPHLDIINDLLDEDKSNAKAATNLQYHHPRYQNHHHLFNRHYSFPSNADIGSYSNPSHLDERLYGSSTSSPLDRHGDGQYSHMDLSAYAHGQLQGVMQDQWPYSTADLSMLSLGNATDASGYSYQLPDYPNGVNGYMYTRPGNGH